MAAPEDVPARPDLYVVARFLDVVASAADGHPRTRLQAAVRLNYDLFRRYFALLERRGWLHVAPGKDGDDRVHLTPSGRDAHHRLVAWIRDAFGEMRL